MKIKTKQTNGLGYKSAYKTKHIAQDCRLIDFHKRKEEVQVMFIYCWNFAYLHGPTINIHWSING